MTRTLSFAFSPSLAAAVLGSGMLWAAAHAAQPAPAATATVPAAPSAQELAQRQSDRAAERANIAHQRSVVRAELAEREKGCWQKFAVEDCLRQARAQAREQERVLRERDLLVSRQERQERADLRLADIARKQADRPLPGPMDSTARPPLPGTAADIEQAQRSRAQEAQQRAQAQQQRQLAHEAEVQAREASEAQRRAQAAREYADKQREAAERRARKQADIDSRTGQPLALPPGVPAP